MTRARDLAAFVSNADGDIKFDTDTLFIDSSENRVGIGTTTPSTKLHVNSTDTSSEALATFDRSDGAVSSQIYYDGSDGAISFGTTTNHPIAFDTNNTERMRLDSNGNVGIGTTSPSAALDVSYGDYQNSGAIKIGADLGQNTSRTDASRKFGAITAAHFDNDEADLGLITMDSSSASVSGLTIGGGSSSFNSASTISFQTSSDGASAGTTRMTIDSSGNVGIGTSSPAAAFSTGKSLDVNGPVFVRGVINAHQTNAGVLEYGSNETRIRSYGATSGSGNILFTTGGGGSADTERMRIDSSGNLLVARTSTGWNGGGGILASGAVESVVASGYSLFGRGVDTGTIIDLRYNNSNVGSISTNGTSTSYNTSSDYRLKENVTNVTDGITRVKQLSPKRFNFIADADTTVDGFLAHEVQSVVPEAITGTHNEVDDDGNPVYQGIDQSKLVPLLTAALQEAIAKIETLETENTAIKARLDALEA